jgi:hypothetical protein
LWKRRATTMAYDTTEQRAKDFDDYILYRFRIAELIDLRELAEEARRQTALKPLVPTLNVAIVS